MINDRDRDALEDILVRAYLVGTGFPDEIRQICVRDGY